MFNSNHDSNSIINSLKNLGYFKYVSSTELSHVLTQARNNLEKGLEISLSDNPDIDPMYLDYRMYNADAEDLAEGGIGELLEKMRPLHKNIGANSSIRDDKTSEKYDVVINDKRYSIFTAETIGSFDSWEIAFVRFLNITNELLKNANSQERLYGMYGGNDGIVIFLTEDLYQFITENNLFKISYLPD